jgi:hypothetical protein
MAFVFNRDIDNHGASTTSTAESANSIALVLAGLAAQYSRARLTTLPRAKASKIVAAEPIIAQITATCRSDPYLANHDVPIFRYPPSRHHGTAYLAAFCGRYGVAPAARSTFCFAFHTDAAPNSICGYRLSDTSLCWFQDSYRLRVQF